MMKKADLPSPYFLKDSWFENPYEWKSQMAYSRAIYTLSDFITAIDEEHRLVQRCCEFGHRFLELGSSFTFDMWLLDHSTTSRYERTDPKVFEFVYDQILEQSTLLLSHGRTLIEMKPDKSAILIKFEPN